MRLTARSKAITASAAILSSASAIAQDAEGPECGTFMLTYENAWREYIDHGAEGPSTGDQLISLGYLIDEAGNQVGEVDIITTVLAAPDDEHHPVLAILHHTFPNGSLNSVVRGALPDASDVSRGTAATHERPITGGSGEFAHATGTATSVQNPDGSRAVTFNLICHD